MRVSTMELMKLTPKYICIGLLFVFTIAVFAITITIPAAAFPVGALIWMCYIHCIVNVPVINHKEKLLYDNCPQRFIDIKTKIIFQFWAVGTLLMALLFVAGVNIEYVDPETIMPEIDTISSLVLLMVSLTLFIPLTFFLTKASYVYNEWIIGLTTIAILILMLAGILMTLAIGYEYYYDYVPTIPHFEIFPYLLISICALAASLFIAYLLSKNIKKIFIQYVKDNT